MRFNWTVFTVALIFSFVVGALSHRLFYLGLFRLSPEVFDWLWSLIMVGGFIISPLLVFAIFYFIGRNIDLVSDFLSVFVSLFTGSWTGQLIGRFLIHLYISQALEYAPSNLFSTLLQYLWTIFTLAFSLEFFVGFTALAVAHIMKNVRTRA